MAAVSRKLGVGTEPERDVGIIRTEEYAAGRPFSRLLSVVPLLDRFVAEPGHGRDRTSRRDAASTNPTLQEVM